MRPYLMVTGDFGRFGGMDWANHALAMHLADLGHVVHLVAFSAAEDLTQHPNVRFHAVAKPLGSYFLGFPLLSQVGRRWALRVTSEQGRVIVNGGNCRWSDINWVHYLHSAYQPTHAKAWNDWRAARFRQEERRALLQARHLVTTAERNRQDLVRLFAIDRENITVIPLGIDPDRFRPPTAPEREAARRELGISGSAPVLGFIGALGDQRKGFDTLYGAWSRLNTRLPVGSSLLVAGDGRELPHWRERAKADGLLAQIHFLGFHRDIPKLLWACDALAAPSRYEPYSLAAQEALASGIPCFISRQAGVADRYPRDLSGLLIDDPENVTQLSEILESWIKQSEMWRQRVSGFGASLRAFTWTRMAEQWVNWMTSNEDVGAQKESRL